MRQEQALALRTFYIIWLLIKYVNYYIINNKLNQSKKGNIMASFAYIKELFEKKDKNGNGYLDLLVIGSDKKEYPAKVWQFDNNGQFEKDDVVEIEYTLDNYRGKTNLQSHLLKKRHAI